MVFFCILFLNIGMMGLKKATVTLKKDRMIIPCIKTIHQKKKLPLKNSVIVVHHKRRKIEKLIETKINL